MKVGLLSCIAQEHEDKDTGRTVLAGGGSLQAPAATAKLQALLNLFVTDAVPACAIAGSPNTGSI